MKGKCWKCGKMNEEKRCGYFWCSCNGGLWYLPVEAFNSRKEASESKNRQLFLDDEEKGQLIN